MRFAGAAEEGLNEEQLDMVLDGFETSELCERDKVILSYTDVFLNNPAGLSEELKQKLHEHFSDEQIVELTCALALFMGFSKIAIALGGMPDELPLMQMPTPE